MSDPGSAWPPPPPRDPSGSRRQPARRRPVGWAGDPRSSAWGIAILAIVVILVRTHRITSDEIIVFCVLIPSIILHEISHGVVALAFGDDTAKRAGRLTLNPIAHVDLVGTIILPAIMALTLSGGLFGWAKPVPVNVGRLRSPRNQGVLVSLAGPATNLVLVALAVVLFHVGDARQYFFVGGPPIPVWAKIVYYLGVVNLWVALFNMIPIPPLDGSVLLERLLPRSWWPGYLRIRPYTLPILFGLVLADYALHLGLLNALHNDVDTWWANLSGLT